MIGFSTTTQEQVTGAVVFLSAYVERPNGFAHLAFGTKPQRMFILRTTSGRFIVRFMELPSDLYWPGPYQCAHWGRRQTAAAPVRSKAIRPLGAVSRRVCEAAIVRYWHLTDIDEITPSFRALSGHRSAD